MGLSVSLSRIESPEIVNRYADEHQMAEDGVILILDLDEAKTLHEFLEPSLHPFIFQRTVEIVDNDAVSEQFGASVCVTGMDESGWLLSNGVSVPDNALPMRTVTSNAVATRELLYLGGSSSFDDAIFDEYNARECYPSWFTLEGIKRYYKHLPNVQERWNQLIQAHQPHLERLFVDLGY